jgi:hypothetical protein
MKFLPPPLKPFRRVPVFSCRLNDYTPATPPIGIVPAEAEYAAATLIARFYPGCEVVAYISDYSGAGNLGYFAGEIFPLTCD